MQAKSSSIISSRLTDIGKAGTVCCGGIHGAVVGPGGDRVFSRGCSGGMEFSPAEVPILGETNDVLQREVSLFTIAGLFQ